jgi:hypothetical protein
MSEFVVLSEAKDLHLLFCRPERSEVPAPSFFVVLSEAKDLHLLNEKQHD